MNSVQLAMMPNHDPMVGKMVGQLFRWQEWNEQPQKVHISGQIDGREPIKLTYEKKEDSSVTVDGFVGSVEVHEVITPVVRDAEGGGFFGAAGMRHQEQLALVKGTIGGQAEELQMANRRESRDVELTEEMKQRGEFRGAFGTRVGMTPSFGGDPVPVNYNPVQLPTASTPVQTTDNYMVVGKVGEQGVYRNLQWTTTAWTVSSNDRDSWGHTEFYQVQDAAFLQDAGQLKLPEPTPMKVEKYTCKAEGTMVLEGPNGAKTNLPFSATYEQARGKAAMEVEQRLGDHRATFTVYAEK